MRWNRERRALLQEFEDRMEQGIAAMSGRVESSARGQWSVTRIAVTAGCVVGGLAVLAGGLYAGNEIRRWYRVQRRTPYDYYAHAGDRRQQTDMDSVVGI